MAKAKNSCCYKKGLKTPFSKEKFEQMFDKVERSYGTDGRYSFNGLHDFCNTQNDVVRSREWSRAVSIMTEAADGRIDNNGYTLEEIGEPLLAKIRRLRQVKSPDDIPAYAVASARDACYFALAIAQLRKGVYPCCHSARKTRNGRSVIEL